MIAKLVDYINNHLSEDLSLGVLAQEVSYSEYYICRIFKKVTNYTLTNYIVEKRIALSLIHISVICLSIPPPSKIFTSSSS